MTTNKDTRTGRALSYVLRLFAKVEPAEAVTVCVMTLTVFLLLTAYYLLKTAREPLILLHGGAEVKSYASAGQAVLLLGFIQVYGWVARKVGRMRLLIGVYLFFASNLVLFAALARSAVPVAVPFYLWVGVYNFTSVAQFWGFASDIYKPEQGKRVFAVLGIGSSVGAVVGAYIAKALVPLGPQALMLGGAILLGVCCALLIWVNAREHASANTEHNEKDKAAEEKPLSEQSAFALLLHDKFLLLLAAMTLLVNWCNSSGEYLLDRTLLEYVKTMPNQADSEVFVGQFKATYFAWTNGVGVLLQLFVVSRILAKVGPRVALFFLPVVAFAGYTVVLFSPLLALVRLAKVAENGVDYSVHNTAAQSMYLVATRVEKFVGKTAVDSLFVRLGDVFSAGVVLLGTYLHFPTRVFAAVNLGLILVWLFVVVLVGREHKRRSEEMESKGEGSDPEMSPAAS